jgi:hypothetical protein
MERRLTLDPSKLLKRLEKIEEGEAIARERFRGRSTLEVVYEELVRAPKIAFGLVAQYLGIEGIDYSQIKLRRQNPETLQQLIINYDEIKALLSKTRFAEYLDS